jgi:Pvc16 N-terminal domain
MTNGNAIAAVTKTLWTLLADAAQHVSIKPLDKARDEAAGEQLNLFLYSVPLAAAFRNSDPTGLRPGESGSPPLPLTLHYLVTAYGADEAAAHKVLGQAMHTLHDHMLLSPKEIKDNEGNLDSGLDQQVERLKITPLPLTNHDMFELWSGFATNYRVSAAYEVSVVLIDSTRKPRTPLPVLQRGASAVAGGSAVLTAVLPPEGATVATLGTTVRVVGTQLGAVTGFELRYPGWDEWEPLDHQVLSEQECLVQLPAAATWAAGFYQLRAVTTRDSLPRVVSNSVPMALGPKIKLISDHTVPAGDVTVKVECMPRIGAEQVVALLLGADTVTPTTIDTPAGAGLPSTVTATFPAVEAATYTVRLRVDLVDSDPVSYAGSPLVPKFDPDVQVEVQ